VPGPGKYSLPNTLINSKCGVKYTKTHKTRAKKKFTTPGPSNYDIDI